MTEIIRLSKIDPTKPEITSWPYEESAEQLLSAPILHFTTSMIKARLFDAAIPSSLPIAHFALEVCPGEREMEEAYLEQGSAAWATLQQYLPAALAAHKMSVGMLQVEEWVRINNLPNIGGNVVFMASDTGVLDSTGKLISKPRDYRDAEVMLRGLQQITQQAGITMYSRKLGLRIGTIATRMVRRPLTAEQAEQFLIANPGALYVPGAIPITSQGALAHYDIPPSGLVSTIRIYDSKNGISREYNIQTPPEDHNRTIQRVYGYDPDLLLIMLAEDIEK